MYIPLTFEGALQKCLFASGGYEGYFISGSQEYKYHLFTGSANLEVQKGTIDNVQIYVVGGGGGGGNRNTARGAGGGGGGAVNYTMNGRLFQGTYSVSIGGGGANQTTGNSNGFSGGSSQFIGSNLSMTAPGGGGGIGLDASTGGTGGTPNGGNGGNGGTSTGGNGSLGVLIYLDEYGNGYGCGGGGAEDVFGGAPSGFSCNGVQYGAGASGGSDAGEGAPNYGMGGGGGNGSRIGKGGGSGVVIIQYPIYDYCSNYFNETGSCDCRQITFDITDPLNYYPQYTGSYLYTQCGTNTFVSGTLQPYYPKTVCAASGSWFWVVSNSGYGNSSNPVNSTYPQCLSASYGVETCVTQSFPPTCNSNLYTFSNSGSGASQIYWVPKNSGNLSYSNLGAGAVTYQCVSNGTIGSIGSYPYGGSAGVFTTASCSNTTFTATWNGVGSALAAAIVKFTQCNGVVTEIGLERGATSGTTVRSVSFCSDGTGPITTRYAVSTPIPTMTVSYGSSCLGNYIDTGSCGCP